MSAWKVLYTEHAEQDLRNIYEHIAFSLLEPEIARKQVQRIMDAGKKLNKMPFRFRLYEKEPWHSKGLHILPVDNYLVFYLPMESTKTVAIIRVMYGGRDIDTQLRQTIN